MPASLVSAFAAGGSTTSPSSATTKKYSTIQNRGSYNFCSSHLSATGGSNKNLSSSEQERRDEDRRRQERKNDVVIGRTSAKRDASDHPINPEATEQEFLFRASRDEKFVHQFTDEGMDAIKSLRLDLADKYFDKVFELRPEAYLWQAGIVKFYLGNTKEASRIFANSASYFEKKFGPMGMGPASEERIWRNASELKYFHSLSRAKRKQYLLDKEEDKSDLPIAQIIPQNDDMGPETRKVHRLASELFDASVNQHKSAEVVARAKLLSLADHEKNPKSSGRSMSNTKSLDIKKRKLNACYFLALHYDVIGEIEESKKWIKTAFKLCSMNAGKSSDIIDTLPLLHMTIRDWFDDDPYDEGDEGFEIDDQNTSDGITSPTEKLTSRKTDQHMSDAYSDPVLEASIMEDIENMKFIEVREALQIRGISVTGDKETLKERLFISLMDDAGYQSGFSP